MKSGLDTTLLMLLAATTVTWMADRLGWQGPLVAVGLLLLVGWKGWLIIYEFMGLRWADWRWRALMVGWLTMTVVVLMAMTFLGPRGN